MEEKLNAEFLTAENGNTTNLIWRHCSFKKTVKWKVGYCALIWMSLVVVLSLQMNSTVQERGLKPLKKKKNLKLVPLGTCHWPVNIWPGVELHGYCQFPSILREYMFTASFSINRQAHAHILISCRALHSHRSGVCEVLFQNIVELSTAAAEALKPWLCNQRLSVHSRRAQEVDRVIRRRQSQLLVMWTNTLRLQTGQRKVWTTHQHKHALLYTHRKQAGCKHAVINWHFTKNCSDYFLSSS